MKNKYIFENKTLVFFQWNQSMEQQTISGIFFCQPMVKSTVFLSMSEPTNRKSVRQLLSLELSNRIASWHSTKYIELFRELLS